MHFFRAPPRDPEPNQSPPNLDTATRISSLHLFCLLLFLVRLIKSFKESLAAANSRFSLSPQFVAYPDSSLLFFRDCNSSSHARARARGGFPTLCVLRSPVPLPTRCEKGTALNLCGNDTRLNWCMKTKHVSTCMKRTKVLRVFKRHASQPV